MAGSLTLAGNCHGPTTWKSGRFSCSVSAQPTVQGGSSTAALSARYRVVSDVQVGPRRGVPRSGHWPLSTDFHGAQGCHTRAILGIDEGDKPVLEPRDGESFPIQRRLA